MNQIRSHFMLIKQSGYDAKLRPLTAYESAKALMLSGLWPLWSGTRCKHMVSVGHQLLIYAAGFEKYGKCVIGTARVQSLDEWKDAAHKNRYPLMLDGIPEKVLIFDDVSLFDVPVDLRTKLDTLSFVPKNKKKWGVAMMGGMRSLSEADYATIIDQE